MIATCGRQSSTAFTAVEACEPRRAHHSTCRRKWRRRATSALHAHLNSSRPRPRHPRRGRQWLLARHSGRRRLRRPARQRRGAEGRLERGLANVYTKSYAQAFEPRQRAPTDGPVVARPPGTLPGATTRWRSRPAGRRFSTSSQTGGVDGSARLKGRRLHLAAAKGDIDVEVRRLLR